MKLGGKKYLHTRNDDGAILALLHLYMQDPNKRALVEYLVKNERGSHFWQPLIISRIFNVRWGSVMMAMDRLAEHGVLIYNKEEQNRWKKGEHFSIFIQAAKAKLSGLDAPETRKGDDLDGRALQKDSSKPENVNQTAS